MNSTTLRLPGIVAGQPILDLGELREFYIAKVNNRLVTVRVDRASENWESRMTYGVTNMATGRQTTFRSAAKFRRAADADEFARANKLTPGQIMRAEREADEVKQKPWPKNPVTGETIDSQGAFQRAVSDILNH